MTVRKLSISAGLVLATALAFGTVVPSAAVGLDAQAKTVAGVTPAAKAKKISKAKLKKGEYGYELLTYANSKHTCAIARSRTLDYGKLSCVATARLKQAADLQRPMVKALKKGTDWSRVNLKQDAIGEPRAKKGATKAHRDYRRAEVDTITLDYINLYSTQHVPSWTVLLAQAPGSSKWHYGNKKFYGKKETPSCYEMEGLNGTVANAWAGTNCSYFNAQSKQVKRKIQASELTTSGIACSACSARHHDSRPIGNGIEYRAQVRRFERPDAVRTCPGSLSSVAFGGQGGCCCSSVCLSREYASCVIGARRGSCAGEKTVGDAAGHVGRDGCVG